MVKASLSNDESCNNDEEKRDYKKTEAASEEAKREHCCGFEQKPEAIEEMLLNAFCRGEFPFLFGLFGSHYWIPLSKV